MKSKKEVGLEQSGHGERDRTVPGEMVGSDRRRGMAPSTVCFDHVTSVVISV